jgi:hypothetical protein
VPNSAEERFNVEKKRKKKEKERKNKCEDLELEKTEEEKCKNVCDVTQQDRKGERVVTHGRVNLVVFCLPGFAAFSHHCALYRHRQLKFAYAVRKRLCS